MREEIQALFEWLHRHPETGLEEYETTRRLRQVLEAHGIQVLDSGLGTGLIAVIHGSGAGRWSSAACSPPVRSRPPTYATGRRAVHPG